MERGEQTLLTYNEGPPRPVPLPPSQSTDTKQVFGRSRFHTDVHFFDLRHCFTFVLFCKFIISYVPAPNLSRQQGPGPFLSLSPPPVKSHLFSDVQIDLATVSACPCRSPGEEQGWRSPVISSFSICIMSIKARLSSQGDVRNSILADQVGRKIFCSPVPRMAKCVSSFWRVSVPYMPTALVFAR